ncbi:hypothetical protein BYT27DRAFT_7157339 [Phlegmacium glaucopus]|nr:hypothetical protein BYT27DRAFT_7157339 [Phlegmacium glaucopus]
MTLKRKLDADSDDVSPVSTKQLKLVPFPNIELDTDVTMSEAEPLYPNIHHSRLPSGASSISSCASDSPISGIATYPSFDLYPVPFFHNIGMVDPNSDNSALPPNSSPVGLLQPSSPFIHHGANCTQIPKLRIACASSVNGHRTMWSHCEQCGAISVVDCD